MANLLVVDDDVEIAEVCADLLRAEGHSVRIARNGEQGLAQVASEIPDLILCDVEMPTLDGPHMALQLFLQDVGRENIPILLSSAVRDLRRVAGEVGTPYFLAKPFTGDQLLALLGRALAERAAPRPNL